MAWFVVVGRIEWDDEDIETNTQEEAETLFYKQMFDDRDSDPGAIAYITNVIHCGDSKPAIHESIIGRSEMPFLLDKIANMR